MSVLENQTPEAVSSYTITAITLLENYGWVILVGILLIVYLYSTFKPKLVNLKKQHDDWKAKEESKKNPDKAHRVQVSMEQARLRLQEKVNVDAEKKKLLQSKREEEARRKNIEEWEMHKLGRGYHSKSRPLETPKDEEISSQPKPKKKTTPRQSEFNALSGAGGGSCSYRPSSRFSGGSGG